LVGSAAAAESGDPGEPSPGHLHHVLHLPGGKPEPAGLPAGVSGRV